MGWLELPHTRGCLVCGRHNPHGLQLASMVDPETGVVRLSFCPRHEHIGFEGIVHGGLLATVMDEAMVWAATWPGRRFCVCGELTVRYRRSASVGRTLLTEARVEAIRSRLIETVAEMRDPDGALIATGSGKYVPMTPQQNLAMMASLVQEPATAEALQALRRPPQ